MKIYQQLPSPWHSNAIYPPAIFADAKLAFDIAGVACSSQKYSRQLINPGWKALMGKNGQRRERRRYRYGSSIDKGTAADLSRRRDWRQENRATKTLYRSATLLKCRWQVLVRFVVNKCQSLKLFWKRPMALNRGNSCGHSRYFVQKTATNSTTKVIHSAALRGRFDYTPLPEDSTFPDMTASLGASVARHGLNEIKRINPSCKS